VRILKLAVATTVLFLSTGTGAASILVSSGTLEYGYGLSGWVNMTAAMDEASAGNIDVTNDFENFAQMQNYDALWLDIRGFSDSLSVNEINNITQYIESGRRVVMMGEHSLWSSWDEQILGVVGGALSIDSTTTRTRSSPVISNDITSGVGLVNMPTSVIAVGGTALFEQNVITLWGNNNVLTILDINICSNSYWNPDNAALCGNIANWVASPSVTSVPVPGAIWLFSSGLIGLIGLIGASKRKRLRKLL